MYNHRYDLGFTLDAHTAQFGGSDYKSFIRAGYPAIEISEGAAMEIWSGFDPYYHRIQDTSDKLSAQLVLPSTQMMIAVSALIFSLFLDTIASPLFERRGL